VRNSSGTNVRVNAKGGRQSPSWIMVAIWVRWLLERAVVTMGEIRLARPRESTSVPSFFQAESRGFSVTRAEAGPARRAGWADRPCLARGWFSRSYVRPESAWPRPVVERWRFMTSRSMAWEGK